MSEELPVYSVVPLQSSQRQLVHISAITYWCALTFDLEVCVCVGGICTCVRQTEEEERRQSDSWQPCSQSNSRLPAVLTSSCQQAMTHSTNQWLPLLPALLVMCMIADLISLFISRTSSVRDLKGLKGATIQSTCEYVRCFTNTALQRFHVCSSASALFHIRIVG